jgi:hypothetical protein
MWTVGYWSKQFFTPSYWPPEVPVGGPPPSYGYDPRLGPGLIPSDLPRPNELRLPPQTPPGYESPPHVLDIIARGFDDDDDDEFLLLLNP